MWLFFWVPFWQWKVPWCFCDFNETRQFGSISNETHWHASSAFTQWHLEVMAAIETKLPGFYTSTMGETQSWEESWRPSGWVVVNGHICLLYPIVLVATFQCTLQLEVYDNGNDPSSTSKALYIYLKNDWRWLSRVIIYAFFKYGIAVLEPCKHGVWHPGGVLTPIQCTMTSCPTFWGERVRHDKSWRELVAPGTQLFGVFGMGPGIPMDYQSI